jgi:hypothetical protein
MRRFLRAVAAEVQVGVCFQAKLGRRMPSDFNDLTTTGRPFWHRWDPIVTTTLFHWFTPTDGNLSGHWTPMEGRENWTGERAFWVGQIKQIMRANIDLVYVHLITRFEQQRINFFAALQDLRKQGWDVPKVAPFLDPFGIWPPAKLDVSTPEGKDEVASHYIRWFQQYFDANPDSLAETYLARIDNKQVLMTWWGWCIWENLGSLHKDDIEVRLLRALQHRTTNFNTGIHMVSTALIDPDIEFADERVVMFSGFSYCVHSTHNIVHSYHVQGGYWDQNIRSPGFFMPRAGGRHYRNAWEYALSCFPVHRIYVESWNEYDEGSGIFAADPSGPMNRKRDLPNDVWSATGDPFEYIKITADGAARFNKLPESDAKVIAHNLPQSMLPGETRDVRVVVRNHGNGLWNEARRTAFALRPGSGFGAACAPVVDAQHECELYGGVFRGRPVDLRFRITAPQTPGEYRTVWSMRHGDSEWFGQALELPIIVSRQVT